MLISIFRINSPRAGNNLEGITDSHIINHRLASAWILGIALVVALVAILTGPYPWAVSLRSRVTGAGRAVAAAGRAAVTSDVDDPAARWVASHRELLQGGAIVVGILVLLVFDLSWLAILLLGLLVAAVVVGTQRIADVAAGGEGEEGTEGEAPEAEVPAEAPPASPV